MSGKPKDWSAYERAGVPVEKFYLLAHAIRVFGAANGVNPTNFSVANFTEEICEEWLEHHPNGKEAKKQPTTEVIRMVPPPGHKAPPLEAATAICGHKSDPDPQGNHHFCTEPMNHIGQHSDQEWYWFLSDWKPTKKTL